MFSTAYKFLAAAPFFLVPAMAGGGSLRSDVANSNSLDVISTHHDEDAHHRLLFDEHCRVLEGGEEYAIWIRYSNENCFFRFAGGENRMKCDRFDQGNPTDPETESKYFFKVHGTGTADTYKISTPDEGLWLDSEYSTTSARPGGTDMIYGTIIFSADPTPRGEIKVTKTVFGETGEVHAYFFATVGSSRSDGLYGDGALGRTGDGTLAVVKEATDPESDDASPKKRNVRFLKKSCLGASTTPSGGPSGGGDGDPHFKKWDGQWFDFHGICDQVLVASPGFDNGLGLDIHVRTKPRFQYSYIESSAIKIGEDIFQVGSWGQYWLNGVEGVNLPITLANKYVVDLVLDNKKHHNFVISLNEAKKESIVINVFKDMVNVNVENATVANFGASSGLLGSFPSGEMMARDGATVIEDNNLFGQEWQVLDTDRSLFLSANPYQRVAGVCVPPTASESRRLGESIDMEAAQNACAHHEDQVKRDMCIFDVMAMADLEVAEMNGAY